MLTIFQALLIYPLCMQTDPVHSSSIPIIKSSNHTSSPFIFNHDNVHIGFLNSDFLMLCMCFCMRDLSLLNMPPWTWIKFNEMFSSHSCSLAVGSRSGRCQIFSISHPCPIGSHLSLAIITISRSTLLRLSTFYQIFCPCSTCLHFYIVS